MRRFEQQSPSLAEELYGVHAAESGDPAWSDLPEAARLRWEAVAKHVSARSGEAEKEQARILVEVLNESPVIAWAIDRDGTQTIHTGGAVKFLGATPGQLVGQNVFTLY